MFILAAITDASSAATGGWGATEGETVCRGVAGPCAPRVIEAVRDAAGGSTSRFETVRLATGVDTTLACPEAGVGSGILVDALKPQRNPATPATAAVIVMLLINQREDDGAVEDGISSGIRSGASAERSSLTAMSPSKTSCRRFRFQGGDGGTSLA